jgi:N-acetylglucosamine kinase-like BadF-type ATPase
MVDLVLGVDGGGTKTVAWLAPLDDAGGDVVLGRGHAGPGNPRAAGFDAALANIDAAINDAFTAAKLPRQTVASACFCLAGAGRASEQEHITAWAVNRKLAQRVRVTGDAEPVLAAASSENCGIALISGTGSLAWGRNAAGETARTGGWGYLLGDEGSGYAIALSGCRKAVQAADGRGAETELLPRLLEALGATTPSDFVEKIYHPDMTHERIASLAAVVFEVAQRDAAAQEIVDTAAKQLAHMTAVLAERLGFAATGFLLALAGGVLLTQDALCQRLMAHLSLRDCTPRDVQLVSEPVRGAVALARLRGSIAERS